MFVAIAWIVIVLGDTARPSRPWLVNRMAANPADARGDGTPARS
jgi:hypothetical protein